MNKNNKLNNAPDAKNHVEVIIFPEGENIRYRFSGKIACAESNAEHETHMRTLPKEDDIWNLVFGGVRATKRFLKKNKSVKLILPISALGYGECDSLV